MAKSCHRRISQISGGKKKKMEILIPRFSFLLWIVGLVNNSVLMALSSSVAIHRRSSSSPRYSYNLLTFEPRISVPPGVISGGGKPRRLCNAQPPSLSRDVRGFKTKDLRLKPSRRGRLARSLRHGGGTTVSRTRAQTET